MFVCYCPGRGRLSRYAFGQRNWWSVCRFQDYFNARPQPPGLAGTVTFTAVLPEKFGKVTWGRRRLVFSSSSFVLGDSVTAENFQPALRKRRERFAGQSKGIS